MLRLTALAFLVVSFAFATTGCGRSGENQVIKPETTQTAEELAAIDQEREAGMETSNLAE